jgi:hypothetical protein
MEQKTLSSTGSFVAKLTVTVLTEPPSAIYRPECLGLDGKVAKEGSLSTIP